MSASVIQQMLRIGKGSSKAKSLQELLSRLNIKRRTSSANLSSFSILTEGWYLYKFSLFLSHKIHYAENKFRSTIVISLHI